MSNAFAPIVRARPNPIFGRPVHQGSPPIRLQPDTSPQTLRIPDRSGHPVLRDTPSNWLQVRLGCFRLSPACPFRLLHTLLLSRPARHYPRLWIQRPSSERRGDFNPHDSCAAQRTLLRSPTPACASLPTSLPLIGLLTRFKTRTPTGLLGSRMNLPYRAVSKHLGTMGE